MRSRRTSPIPRSLGLCASSHGLGIPLSKVGFPIRKSTDQSFFAAPRGLSQRSTSFIASQRQGIHRMPLRHLIALIINAHSHSAWRPRRLRAVSDRALIRKTSLLRDRSDGACGQAWTTSIARHAASTLRSSRRMRSMLEIARVARDFRHARSSERSPLHDVRQHAPRDRRDRREYRFASGRADSRSDSTDWWSQTGSNRRPPACKAGALPTELWPRAGTAQHRHRDAVRIADA